MMGASTSDMFVPFVPSERDPTNNTPNHNIAELVTLELVMVNQTTTTDSIHHNLDIDRDDEAKRINIIISIPTICNK